MARILIADDQVPDSELESEDSIREYYRVKYKDDSFAEGFVFISKLINSLISNNHEVTAKKAYSEVIDEIKKSSFDLIILDLGFWTEKNLNYNDKMHLGWKIAKEMRTITVAPIIMFSNRFYENEKLAATTAEMGILPVYKSYNDECLKHILVTIRYSLTKRDIKKEVDDNLLNFDFNIYRKLTSILLFSIISSGILFIISLLLMLIKYSDASLVTSITGFITTFINGVIFKYIKYYRKRTN